ncbi:Transcription elongation factor [hydrothermal vent metagenome]|uniref:Transcription elongation factor n=1 Tax=hydrothermal vent metagenome TaxID=652676 RepID=A0A3B0X959_9ZZZZ
MDKRLLIKAIIAKLTTVHQTAVDAAQRAYDTATDEENEAENKYDTLGLEASYLAYGQSKRVLECEADLIKFKKLKEINFSSKMPIAIGALVCVEDEQSRVQWFFLSSVAGGLNVSFNQKEITLITPSAPMGKALLTGIVNDEVDVKIGDENRLYQIVSVY